MPRSPATDAVTAVFEQVGQQLGAALGRGIIQGLEGILFNADIQIGGAPLPRRGAAAALPVASEGACKVPGCGRPASVKGLCKNHYGKARRLQMNADDLSNEQLQTLGQDARSLRGKSAK